jgi:peptidoglycan/xylan/chitin deacetylase (PgdA/CDA1 family)
VNDLLPIPDHLIVLTFDDGCKSCATFAAPLLSDLGFGATFYITEGLDFLHDKQAYATWSEIKTMDEAGFEIGNHLGRHIDVRNETDSALQNDLGLIEGRCEEFGIAKPKTFAYPGSHISTSMVQILSNEGYAFARRGVGPEIEGEEGYFEGGRGLLYEPTIDHPRLIPSAGISGPGWAFEDFRWAVERAVGGRIAVLTYHGVPDPHPHCTTPPEEFETWMRFLKGRGSRVIAMRDLAGYVDAKAGPPDPFSGIHQRMSSRDG